MDVEDRRRYFIVGSVILEIVQPLLRTRLENYYQSLGVSSLHAFLNTLPVLHMLFHLRHRNASCCKDKINCRNNSKLPLIYCQWDLLYTENPSKPGHNCFCNFIANQVQLKELDITLASLILLNCCYLGPTEDNAVCKLRRYKNDYLSHNIECKITETEYKSLWTDLTNSVLKLDPKKQDDLIRIEKRPLDEGLCNRYTIDLLNIHKKMNEMGPQIQEISSGIHVMRPQIQGINSGIHVMRPQIQGINSGIHVMRPQIQGINSGIHVMRPQIQGLNSGMQVMCNQIQKISSGMQVMCTQFQEISSGIQAMCTQIQDISSGIQVIVPQIQDISSGMEVMGPQIQNISSGTQVMDPQIQETSSGTQVVDPQNQDISSGMEVMDPQIQETSSRIEVMDPQIQETSSGMEVMDPQIQETSSDTQVTDPQIQEISSDTQEVLRYHRSQATCQYCKIEMIRQVLEMDKGKINFYELGQDIFYLHDQIYMPSMPLKGHLKGMITDVVIMDDGRLIMCLCSMHRILICTIDEPEVVTMTVNSGPYCLTSVNNSTVAIIVSKPSYCQRIEIYDINNKQRLKSIPIPGGKFCHWGITMINDQLVVTTDKGFVIMDYLTEEIVQTVETHFQPWGLHSSCNRIFYTDSNRSENNLHVYCFTKDKIHTITLPSIPRSMTTLQDGSLYVLCTDGSVQHVSFHGKHFKTLKTNQSQCFSGCHQIHYNLKQKAIMTFNVRTGMVRILHEV